MRNHARGLIAGDFRIGKESLEKPIPGRDSMMSRRGKAYTLVVLISAVAAIALVITPSQVTLAHPSNEGGNCSNCHDTAGPESLLTVTGLPASTYVPAQAYSLTITIADSDLTTGENAFDLLFSGGGTVTTADPKVEINSPTGEASIKETVSTTATIWNLTWTAPSSGQVTFNVWGVGGTGAGAGSPYDLDTFVLNSSAIPEFSLVLVPVVGMLGAMFIVHKISKKKGHK